MKKRIFITALAASAIILEALPYGAVLNFADIDGKIRKTFSYFDLTPFGYANFGPLLTALLTCVLFVFAVIYLFSGKNGMRKAVCILSGAAAGCSLMPLMFGVHNFSVVGAVISAVLAAVFVLTLLHKKN